MNEKMSREEIIKTIVQTLNTIPIAGYDNYNKMMGVFMLLQELAEDGENGNDVPNDK